MGTRRSRHNKGRKPLYKDFERDTVRTSSFDDQPRPREKFVPPPEMRGNYTAPRTQRVVELESAVIRFMERRAEQSKQDHEEVSRRHQPERVSREFPDCDPVGTVRVSNSDILLQMFHHREISGRQLLAGRVWQFNLDRATIQPSATIALDPDAVRQYQARGTISDDQWDSMRRRRIFAEQVGNRYLRLADFCLGQDWRRADLMRSLGVSGGQLALILDDMLAKLAVHFGLNFVERSNVAA